MVMIEKLLLPEVRELLEAGDAATLAGVLGGWHPADLAGVLGELRPEERTALLEALGPEAAARAFAHLERDDRDEVLDALPGPEAAALLERLEPDDRTALFGAMGPDRAARFLALLSPEARATTERLLRYGEETIGRLANPDFVALHPDWTVDEALDHIRARGSRKDTLEYLYVVDEDGRLLDDISVGKFLLARSGTRVRDLMGVRFLALRAVEDRESAVEAFRKYDRTALPVLDDDGALVGVVTIDDVLDVAEEEATEDLQRFGGLEALDDPYVATPFWGLIRRRASWLVVLFIGEMFTATAMGFFEEEIERAVVLALFVPLIISSGGNSGSQAATLIIRALALGEVKLRDWWRVLRRELGMGLVLGAILGAIGFLRIALWSTFGNPYGEYWHLVGLTVTVSLVGVVLWGTISGSMLPFILKRLGFDPATSSAPFVATLVDVTGLVIYFSAAVVILRGTLL